MLVNNHLSQDELFIILPDGTVKCFTVRDGQSALTSMSAVLGPSGLEVVGGIGCESLVFLRKLAPAQKPNIITFASSEGPGPSWANLPSFDGKDAFLYPHGVWVRSFLLLILFCRSLPDTSDLREAIFLAVMYSGVGGSLSFMFKDLRPISVKHFCGSGSMSLAPMLPDFPCWPQHWAFHSPTANSVAVWKDGRRGFVLAPGPAYRWFPMTEEIMTCFLNTRQEPSGQVEEASAVGDFAGKPRELFDQLSQRLRVDAKVSEAIWERAFSCAPRKEEAELDQVVVEIRGLLPRHRVSVHGEVRWAFDELVAPRPAEALRAMKQLLGVDP